MLFTKKDAYRLAVEPGPDYLKWVVFKGAESGEVAEIGAGEWPELDTQARQQVLEKLSEAASRYKIASENIFVSIPRAQATTRHLELPSTDTDEIRKIIDLQAVKQTPYAADEIIYDYYPLDSPREGYTSVMLVIVHRQVINAALLLMEQAKLVSKTITMGMVYAPFALAETWKPSTPDATAAVLDMDLRHAYFSVVQGTKVLFTQIILSDAGSERTVSDTMRALQIYKNEDAGPDPSTFFVIGASERFQGIASQMKAAWTKDVLEIPASSLTSLPSSVLPDVPAKFSFYGLLGLKDRRRATFSLAPQEAVVKASLIEKSRNLLITGILIFSIFLSLVGIGFSKYHQRYRVLAAMKEKEASLRGDADRVLMRRQKIKDLLELHRDSEQVFEVLLQVHRTLPQEMFVTEIQLTPERHLSLQGRSESTNKIFDFVNGLKADKHFTEIDTSRMTKRILNNKEIVDFKIDCKLQLPPELLSEKART